MGRQWEGLGKMELLDLFILALCYLGPQHFLLT